MKHVLIGQISQLRNCVWKKEGSLRRDGKREETEAEQPGTGEGEVQRSTITLESQLWPEVARETQKDVDAEACPNSQVENPKRSRKLTKAGPMLSLMGVWTKGIKGLRTLSVPAKGYCVTGGTGGGAGNLLRWAQ